MVKTEIAAQIKKTQEVFKKDWKIVLFFGNRFAIGKKIRVVELPSSKENFKALTTDAILSVDFTSDEFTMFNTGPCRYIGFNAVHYAGSDLPMAFSNSTPIVHAPLNISVVSLNSENPELVNTTVFVMKVQKMKENLYHIFTETDDYFLTVEQN